MLLKGLKINFLGDSITQGDVGPTDRSKCYHALLKEEAGLAEARNYGMNGTKIARYQGNRGIEKNDICDNDDFCCRFHKMDDDADVVVVFGGTNDYGHGDALLGEFSDRTPDTFYGACHFLFRGLIQKYLGKTIVIMTPLHRTNEMVKTGALKPKPVATLKEYVDIIREVAEFYSLPVLDLYATSGLQPDIEEIRVNYIPDGTHPNNNGHRVIARKLKRFLEAL